MVRDYNHPCKKEKGKIRFDHRGRARRKGHNTLLTSLIIVIIFAIVEVKRQKPKGLICAETFKPL